MISTEERRYLLGGSECAAAAGLSPFMTREGLMGQKLGVLPDVEENWLMWHGKGVESLILDTIYLRPHWLVPPQKWSEGVRVLGDLPTMFHAEFPWACSTRDGLIVEPERTILLEMKTSPTKKVHGWGDAWTADVPTHVACQALWNTMVMLSNGKRVDETWVVAMFGTREPQIFPIPYDAGRAQWLLERGQDFMNELEQKRKERAA